MTAPRNTGGRAAFCLRRPRPPLARAGRQSELSHARARTLPGEPWRGGTRSGDLLPPPGCDERGAGPGTSCFRPRSDRAGKRRAQNPSTAVNGVGS
eukprot:1997738-Prymnesium_polylepis.1